MDSIPESLDVRLGVFESPDAPESNLIDYVGRTEITLEHTKPSRRNLDITLLPNSDGTQLLVLPSSGRPWGKGAYELKLTYNRDYGDETKPIDHRYDRPLEYAGEDSGPAHYLWEWHV